MVYVSKQFSPVQLPDGKEATCAHDIDAYLRRSGLALASDYSPEFLKSARDARNQAMREDLFASFLQQYKRKLWNGK